MQNSQFPDPTSNMILAIQQSFANLAETIFWGKASRQGVLSLVDIKDWYRENYVHHKKHLFCGALLKIQETGGSYTRIYQGIFNSKFECINARQILTTELSSDLQDLFNKQDLVIFTNDKDEFYSNLPSLGANMPIDFLAIAGLLGLVVAAVFVFYSMAMFREWIGTTIGKFRNKQLLAGLVKRRLENDDFELVQFIFDEKQEKFLAAEMVKTQYLDPEVQTEFDKQRKTHPNVIVQEITK